MMHLVNQQQGISQLKQKAKCIAATRLGAIFLCAWALSACVSFEPAQTVPHVNLSPENISLVPSSNESLNFGIDAVQNESDSLENLEVLPGLRVRGVRAGSAGDRAGLKSGDVILSINGVETNSPDTLSAISQAETSAEFLPLRARRGTTVFDTTLPVPQSRDAITPEERYRLDPTKTRAAFRTELLQTDSSKQRAAARILHFEKQSPLPGCGLRENDLVIAVDEWKVDSAQALINRIHENYDYGQVVNFELLRSSENDNFRQMNIPCELWNPGRRLSRFAIWPLITYNSNLKKQESRFSLFDFGPLSLFTYRRTQEEQHYRLLTVFQFSSGLGELVDESGTEN